MLYRRTIYVNRNGAHSYSCTRIWRVGGYFTQRQRSYSSASVYITEPGLPVLMWLCASAEPSRKKQTSVTSDERRPRMEPRRALTHSHLLVQCWGDSSIRSGVHSLISRDDWPPGFMNKLSWSLLLEIAYELLHSPSTNSFKSISSFTQTYFTLKD